jgi:phosphoenolpyruvate synthase/pyruvate phosphate dikinase
LQFFWQFREFIIQKIELENTIFRQFMERIEKIRGFHPEMCLAVRSAAVGEDDGAASYAGQYSTVLGVCPKNVLNAIVAAKKKGMKVVGLSGKTGGVMASLCDVEIRAPKSEFADRAQEIHIKVIHSLIHYIENNI